MVFIKENISKFYKVKNLDWKYIFNFIICYKTCFHHSLAKKLLPNIFYGLKIIEF